VVARLQPDGTAMLILTGKQGATYRIESTPQLGAGATWTLERTVKLTGPTLTIPGWTTTGRARFFRVIEQ
jgi:hypothetical protein